MCFHLQRDSLALPRSESCQEILATTMEIFPHRVPMFMELMQAGTLSLPISLCLGQTCVGAVIAGDFLFLCKSLHMAKLLSTIYQSYRPWLQINNGILIAYRKRKERERDGWRDVLFDFQSVALAGCPKHVGAGGICLS